MYNVVLKDSSYPGAMYVEVGRVAGLIGPADRLNSWAHVQLIRHGLWDHNVSCFRTDFNIICHIIIVVVHDDISIFLKNQLNLIKYKNKNNLI